MFHEGLRQAAKTKGWTIQGASLAQELLATVPTIIDGTEDGVPVQIVRASALHTLATSAFMRPALAFPFAVTTEGVAGAVASVFGVEDVQVGDEDFDKAFRLVSKEPEALKKLLTEEVRAVLRELAASAKDFGANFRVTEQVVWLQRPAWGTLTEAEVLQDIPLCVRAAKLFQTAAG